MQSSNRNRQMGELIDRIEKDKRRGNEVLQ